MRRGSVAESYLNPLAATLESIRINSEASGWRRFLVFAALTKSRKGADYVALFVYFQFQGAVRLILAQGPRQVVNALTLYSVMQANLIPIGSNAATEGRSSFEQFFINVKILASKQEEQAIILFTMLFTLVIWVISALSFIAACLLYAGFLWHYIDGGLTNYCRGKIDRRLAKIVSAQVKKALERQAVRQRKEIERAKKRGHGVVEDLSRQPALPAIMDKSPLVRQTSVATLPAYSIHAPIRQGSGHTARPPFHRNHSTDHSRSTSPSSTASIDYGEDGPLMDNAGFMGGASHKPHPYATDHPRGTTGSVQAARQPPTRTMTGSTHSSAASGPAGRRFPIRTASPYQQQDYAIPMRNLTAQSQRSVSAPKSRGYAEDDMEMPNLPLHVRNASNNQAPPGAWPTDQPYNTGYDHAAETEVPYRPYTPPTYQPLPRQRPPNNTYPQTLPQRSYTPFAPPTGTNHAYYYPDPTDPALQNTDFDRPDAADLPRPPPKRTITYHYPDQDSSRTLATQHPPPVRTASQPQPQPQPQPITAKTTAGGRTIPLAVPKRAATAPLPEFRGYAGELGGLGSDDGSQVNGGYDVYDDARALGLERDRLGRLIARPATAAAVGAGRDAREIGRDRDGGRVRRW